MTAPAFGSPEAAAVLAADRELARQQEELDALDALFAEALILATGARPAEPPPPPAPDAAP